MIKAIVFDCFGVLTTDRWLQFKEKHFIENSELVGQAIELNKQADRGELTYDEFINRIAAIANISASDTRSQIEGNAPNDLLFKYIQEALKPNYKIGMLSNAAGNWLDRIFTPDQVALFDEVVLSYTTGFIKPQPQIYKLVAEKLAAEPSECVFVDDREGYCAAAREVGMQAIMYQDIVQFKSGLQQILTENS